MLKRYAVFAYNQDPGDAGGGIADLKNAFHTREEAEKWVSEMEESAAGSISPTLSTFMILSCLTKE